jgi:hypothetical protein
LPAWGKVGGEGTGLPPDDPALTKDTQTEYLHEQGRLAGGLEDTIRPGVSGVLAASRRPGDPAPSQYDPSYQAPPKDPEQTKQFEQERREREQREGADREAALGHPPQDAPPQTKRTR